MGNPLAGEPPAASWVEVLEAIAQAAVEATDAAAAWVLEPAGAELVAVATVGRPVAGPAAPPAEPSPSGSAPSGPAPSGAAPSGPAGYVLASGQPLALSPSGKRGRAASGVEVSFGVATSVLCVPCPYREAVVGVMELVDKADGGTFSYEDLELATLLAGIAGAALAAGGRARRG